MIISLTLSPSSSSSCSPLLAAVSPTVVLYSCSVGREDCSLCKHADSKYQCVWCAASHSCVYRELCRLPQPAQCPNPEITDVSHKNTKPWPLTCWNFFMDRIGSMFGSLTGLNEWNVCAVTFTLCKTMAVRFIYPSIHLLLFIRCGSRLQQDKQDHLLQMFSPHPASFYVKSLQPYSEAPPDIWSSKSPDTQQMKLVSAIGIRNFPLLVHFSLNSFALGTSSPPTQQSCRPHKNLKHDSQTDLPHIDVLFICKKRITQLGSSFSKITGKKF